MPEGLQKEQLPAFHRLSRIEELGELASTYIDEVSTQAASAFSNSEVAQRAYSVNELLLLQKRDRLVRDMRNLQARQSGSSKN